jgi:hypothetical protein
MVERVGMQNNPKRRQVAGGRFLPFGNMGVTEISRQA